MIIPRQPTVVRGFSKYTRMITTISSLHAGGQLGQAAGVIQRRAFVVDGAGTDDHQQARGRAARESPPPSSRARTTVSLAGRTHR